ncbi:hypothetical protein CB1_000294009 [Camelus ferus]|nr:hypothetical protein CB1_000294009 [Camelus ferus]
MALQRRRLPFLGPLVVTQGWQCPPGGAAWRAALVRLRGDSRPTEVSGRAGSRLVWSGGSKPAPETQNPPPGGGGRAQGDKVSTLSAFVAPFKHVSPGATSTEDEDNLSTSSADVKENRNVSNLEAQPLPVGDRTRGGPPGLKRKRPLEEGGGGPLRQLHLLWRGLSCVYRTVSQTGPVHAPVFAVAVEVNGLTFEGTGPTKKKAKMRAAELALRSFVQFPNACQAHLALGSGASPSPLDLVGTAAPGERNPVVLLNELRSGLRYVCLSEPEKQRAQSFVMAVNVDGRTFEGSGRSKKLAKGQAAQAALQALFDIRLPGHIPSRNKGHLLPQLYPLVLPASGQTVTDPGLWCRADRVHCTFSVPPRSTI